MTVVYLVALGVVAGVLAVRAFDRWRWERRKRWFVGELNRLGRSPGKPPWWL